MLAKDYSFLSVNKPKIKEKYRCSEGQGEEVTITLAVEDAILGKTELILEHKQETDD